MNRFRRMTSRTPLDPHEARLCQEAQVRMAKASRTRVAKASEGSERSVSGASRPERERNPRR